MRISFAEIEERARRLSAEERARLAELLLESLQGTPVADVHAAWEVEISQRVAAFERGESTTYLAEEVFAEARRLIK